MNRKKYNETNIKFKISQQIVSKRNRVNESLNSGRFFASPNYNVSAIFRFYCELDFTEQLFWNFGLCHIFKCFL